MITIETKRAYAIKYNQTDKGKARRKRHRQSKTYKANVKRYNSLPHVQAAKNAFVMKRYYETKTKLDIYKLDKGCIDCGYRNHAEALDFDHRPGETKRFSISGKKTGSWENLMAEINKCELVCANCHRVRTAMRRLTKTQNT